MVVNAYCFKQIAKARPRSNIQKIKLGQIQSKMKAKNTGLKAKER